MDFNKDVLCEAVIEALKAQNLPVPEPAVVWLIVEVAADCFDLGYQAARRETVEDK